MKHTTKAPPTKMLEKTLLTNHERQQKADWTTVTGPRGLKLQ